MRTFMRTTTLAATVLLAVAAAAAGDEPKVTAIRAVHRHGQTFVTFKDVAEGEAGADVRYSLYRSDRPITPDNLTDAELCYHGMLNNSARMLGYGYFQKDRQDPDGPTCVIEPGGQPLPQWSGLAVRTVTADGNSFYAVVATDLKQQPISKVVPGESATTEPVPEKVAPIQPIPQPGADRPNLPSGKAGLPLTVSLHGSNSRGPRPRANGELYLYFGDARMGWRDGLAGVFVVYETPASAGGPQLMLAPTDAIENPSGNGVIETCWFGYFCVPQHAAHSEPRVYPFTENRLEWMIRWTIAKYEADPLRVYSVGQSMGGMASTQFGLRHPELFAALYPRLQRVRQSWLPAVPTHGVAIPTSINKGRWDKPAPMADGAANYFDHMDSVAWVREQHQDLPFYGWACGRTDWVEPWKAYIEMVQALTENRHGFAMAWNNAGHDSTAARAIVHINKYYPAEKFALNRSYPAFSNSSIDDDLGSGELEERDVDGKKVRVLKDGAPEGGINLGFDWSDVVDEPGRWSAKISNELCKAEMTVDVTPRRRQQFKPQPGAKLAWTSSTGDRGELTVDRWGLATVEKLKIRPGEATMLTLSK